jgi:hypothetical protein
MSLLSYDIDHPTLRVTGRRVATPRRRVPQVDGVVVPDVARPSTTWAIHILFTGSCSTSAARTPTARSDSRGPPRDAGTARHLRLQCGLAAPRCRGPPRAPESRDSATVARTPRRSSASSGSARTSRRAQHRAHESAQWLPGPRMGHPRRHRGAGDPEAARGSFFPDWLLVHRRRAEQALVTVIATAYLLGVSTRGWSGWPEQLGVKSLSRSQVSDMASHLDAHVVRGAAAMADQAGTGGRSWLYAACRQSRELDMILAETRPDGHRLRRAVAALPVSQRTLVPDVVMSAIILVGQSAVDGGWQCNRPPT